MVATNSIQSMTGFASLKGHNNHLAWVWQVKSVNAKGLDIRVRLPESYATYEPDVVNAVKNLCARGNITVSLDMNDQESVSRLSVNRDYLYQVLALKEELKGIIVDAPITLDTVLRTKEMLNFEKDYTALEKDFDDILVSFNKCLKQYLKMREEEGKHTKNDILKRHKEMVVLVAKAAKAAEAQPAQIKKKLQKNIKELLDDTLKIDPARLAQEVALQVTKSDVREEIERLTSHLKKVKGIMSKGGAVGRKLDFIAQELNRESNTLCAKAKSLALTDIGIDLKGKIEQFREQIQNIE